ncbi:MAG TPA: thiosulfate oxidation carrier protein SoxY [Gammaproteobacteria bacterium]|nr:thiosulfate oxidation carrier protein SoxY [Gammaproteobacteria bacterium]
MHRRTFLKASLAVHAASLVASIGFFMPRQTFAAWPALAFEKKQIADAIAALTPGATPRKSRKIKINVPKLIENGDFVPVSVLTNIPNTEKISLLVEKNAQALVASFDLGPAVDGYISTRIRLNKTTKIIALVQASGKSFIAKKTVKVKAGRC